MQSVVKNCLYNQPFMPIKFEQSSALKEGTKRLSPLQKLMSVPLLWEKVYTPWPQELSLATGAPLWCSRLRTWYGHCRSWGYYHGSGSIPSLVTSTCHGSSKTKKKCWCLIYEQNFNWALNIVKIHWSCIYKISLEKINNTRRVSDKALTLQSEHLLDQQVMWVTWPWPIRRQ